VFSIIYAVLLNPWPYQGADRIATVALLDAQAGFDCQMHIYSTEGHGFTPEALRDADQRVLQFFEKGLR
jgi:dipeptidyl aminopeptidase/acylaminoacyl peptidase